MNGAPAVTCGFPGSRHDNRPVPKLDPAAALERSQWDHFWIPEDTVAHVRPGLSYLSCPQNLPHQNAVTRTEPDQLELEAITGEVANVHRGVQSRWFVYERIDSARLRTALSERGYAPKTGMDARVISLDAGRSPASSAGRVERVTDSTSLEHFHQVANAGFGLQRVYSKEQLAAQLQQCAPSGSRVQRFVVYDGDVPVSCGGLNAFDALGFGLLWAGSTMPAARGRGFYSALVSTRLDWARRRGLSLVGLYAVTTTSSPIVAKQGFEKYGTLTYWERSPE